MALSVVFLFDRGLFFGICLLSILSSFTVLLLQKVGLTDKKILILFFVALGLHFTATLFMHYADFQPFSGHIGDYLTYQRSAVEISQSFRQGVFSLKDIAIMHPDIYTAHFYPVIIGFLYAITIPEEIIGLMLNVWLAASSVIIIYLIVKEIGGSEMNAFLAGIIVSIYPSYVFYGGLLVKDIVEVFFIILGMLFLLKVIKRVSLCNFLVLYLSLLCATHFRFYIGYALIISFILSWFFLSKIDKGKKMVYGIIFIFSLGFIPQFSAGQGYYGINSMEMYLNSKMVNFYRQVAYDPAQNTVSIPTVSTSTVPVRSVVVLPGFDSSFPIEGGVSGYAKSFIYTLLGPFPWQIKNLRQSLALSETIPWYFILRILIFEMVKYTKGNGIIKTVDHYRLAIPLFLFSIIMLMVIAIFINNFGIITRIRMPGFIAILCIAALAFNEENIIYNYLSRFKIWKNI